MSKTKITTAGERVGIFCIDGGRTTGVCADTVTVRGTVKEIFARDPPSVWQIDCNDQTVHPTRAEVKGAVEIAEEWLAWTAEWTLDGIPSTQQFFVYEDFVINRNPRSWDREGVSPIAVNKLVMGLLYKYPVQWVPQQPSEALTRWTDARLRKSGLWTPGLEHGRVATKHAALWIVKQF